MSAALVLAGLRKDGPLCRRRQHRSLPIRAQHSAAEGPVCVCDLAPQDEAVGLPQASARCSIRWVVVVLPLVPVTPISDN